VESAENVVIPTVARCGEQFSSTAIHAEQITSKLLSECGRRTFDDAQIAAQKFELSLRGRVLNPMLGLVFDLGRLEDGTYFVALTATRRVPETIKVLASLAVPRGVADTPVALVFAPRNNHRR
jgi:hypothetical protein